MKKRILYGFCLLLCITLQTGLQMKLQAQQIAYRPTLPHALAADLALTAEGVEFFATTPAIFQPAGNFSFELEVRPQVAEQPMSLAVEAMNGSSTGWLGNAGQISEAGLYRYVLMDDQVFVYKDGVLHSTWDATDSPAPIFPMIFTETDKANAPQTGIYATQNLIRNPGFEEEGIVLTTNGDGSTQKFWPAEWLLGNASATSAQAMGVRCNKNDAAYANGREGSSAFMFRQDGMGGMSQASNSYLYQKLSAPLQAGRKYKLEFQVLSHTNSFGFSYGVGVGSAAGTWDYLNTTFTDPSTSQTLATYSYTFTAPVTAGNESFVGFYCNGTNGIIHFDRITLVEAEGDYNRLSVATTTGNVEILSMSYAEGAFSPIANITNIVFDGGEYALYHPYYNRLLAANADASSPALTAIADGTVGETQIYVAEASGTDGYFLLRHKASGKYLTASTSNTWSMLLNATRSTANNYQWKIVSGASGKLISRRAEGKQVGSDADKEADTYIGVFYDKNDEEKSHWQIVEAGFPLADARLQLYLHDLEEAMKSAEAFIADESYPNADRALASTKLAQVRILHESATLAQADVITTEAAALHTLLTELRAKNSTTWLTGQNFNLSGTFTLALSGVKQQLNAAVTIVIRGTNGKGASIALPVETDDTQPTHNYLFAFNDTQVHTYVDGALTSTTPVVTLPALTENGTAAEWSAMGLSALEAYIPEVVSATACLTPEEATIITDTNGKPVRYAVRLAGQAITLAAPVDFHIMEEATPLTGSSLNLTDNAAWVIFDNTLPSVVISRHLASIRVNGQPAVLNNNVRVAIYLNGAVVMPYQPNEAAFTGYSEQLYTGDATPLSAGNHALGEKSNSFSSFILRRGYMATVASGAKGSGYSRVYVADHADLLVPQLPQALNQRISSVVVKKWEYVSKKGWASTNSNSSIATETNKMRATWFYTDRKSTRLNSSHT